MDKSILTERLKSLGVEVKNGKVKKMDLEKAIVNAARYDINLSSSTKPGSYTFDIDIEIDYSQIFLDTTKNMSEEDSFEYYDSKEYINWDTDSILNTLTKKTPKPYTVDLSVTHSKPSVEVNGQWTREKAAETLKAYGLTIEVSFQHEITTDDKLHLEELASNVIKEKTGA